MSETEQKVALVTGASRGIGKAIALQLAMSGIKVIGTATTDSGAEAITGYLAAHGGEGKALNVTDSESTTELVKYMTTEHGGIDILINNAGITRDNLLMRLKEDDWDSVINTNLTAIYRLSKAVMRGMMKSRWGRIVSIGSVVGSMGNPGQANYAAAKAGLIGFSKSLAKEIANRGITVNVVAPGFIETDMTKALGDEQRDQLMTQIPASRLGSPEDIAQAVAFLCSDGASYITGETLHVNGGMHVV
ncbi:MAG: 3-oxoacyl-ACP reductase FabG [Gammaproteobacteria bacterium]|nr:3-oxoacyl-ACP reductase FabG [Gammaproteobacteria bacterium]